MIAHKNTWAMLVVLLLVLAAVLSAAAQDEEPLTEEEQANLALVEQFYAIYNDSDAEAIGELLTDDVVWTWNYPFAGTQHGEGKEGALELYTYDQVHRFYLRPVDMTVEGDTVLATEMYDNDEWRRSGTPIIQRSTFQIRDGKIAAWDAVGPASFGVWRDQAGAVDVAINNFAARIGAQNAQPILDLLADDAVFDFSIDPLTGKRVQVKGKENIAAYLDELAIHRVKYNISTLYHLPRHLEAYGTISWGALKQMGIPPLPSHDKITLEDGKIARFELRPLPVGIQLYADAVAQETNKETVRQAVAAYVAADSEAIATQYAEDALRREMSTVDEGLEAIQARAAGLRESFEDFACTVDKVTASGDQVFVQAACTGTNTGAIDEMPATGKAISFPVYDVFTLKDGKIVEESVMFDRADFWEQLGFVLTPAK